MEKIPPRTYEVQAGYILGLQILQDWVDWADEAIVAGFDSQSLRILAGLQPPYDDHEIHRLSNKAFIELNVAPLKKEDCISYYIASLLRQVSAGQVSQRNALGKLRELYWATGQKAVLSDFFRLYHALTDLETEEVQWYWEGANRKNILQIIDDYFNDWLKNHSQNVSA
jgi:hypothetical protein